MKYLYKSKENGLYSKTCHTHTACSIPCVCDVCIYPVKCNVTVTRLGPMMTCNYSNNNYYIFAELFIAE